MSFNMLSTCPGCAKRCVLEFPFEKYCSNCLKEGFNDFTGPPVGRTDHPKYTKALRFRRLLNKQYEKDDFERCACYEKGYYYCSLWNSGEGITKHHFLNVFWEGKIYESEELVRATRLTRAKIEFEIEEITWENLNL